MMFCVLSDSHGSIKSIERLLSDLDKRNIKPNAFIHTGDYAADSEYLRLHTGLTIYAVYGNCDSYSQRQLYKPDEFIQVGEKFIWLTHGHRYIQDQHDLELLTQQAQVFGVDIVVYGHTHKSNVATVDNILFLNPGSISLPRNSNCSYAVLEIEGGSINTNIYEIY